jgi:hypothetical protein
MCSDNTCKKILDDLLLLLFVLLIFCTFFYISTSNTGKKFIGGFNIIIFFLFTLISSVRMCDYGPFAWMIHFKECFCRYTEDENPV